MSWKRFQKRILKRCLPGQKQSEFYNVVAKTRLLIIVSTWIFVGSSNCLFWPTCRRLGITELEYEMRRNLARTYRDCGYVDKAIEMFKETTLMQEDNWLARWGLATSCKMIFPSWYVWMLGLPGVGEISWVSFPKSSSLRLLQLLLLTHETTDRAQEKWELATEILGEVIRTTKSDISKEFNPKTHLPEMQREFAESTWNSGNYERAIELYETIMKEDPNDYDTRKRHFCSSTTRFLA